MADWRPMSDQDLFDHGQRIAQLERKVSELYRELTGLGLREAKDAVDRLSQLYRPGG